MNQIREEMPLPSKLKDHTLLGNWNEHRELHLEPDWLLIYKINDKSKTVIFVRVGTHSDLFR
jgi:mRNA interferase YafQ